MNQNPLPSPFLPICEGAVKAFNAFVVRDQYLLYRLMYYGLWVGCVGGGSPSLETDSLYLLVRGC